MNLKNSQTGTTAPSKKTGTTPSKQAGAAASNQAGITPWQIPTPEKVNLKVVLGMSLAMFTLYIALLGPPTVSLALKIQSIYGLDDSPTIVGMVSSVGAIFAFFANPICGRLSDYTTSRFGRRRPWMFSGAIVFLVALCIMAFGPNQYVVAAGWAIGQVGGNMILAPLMTTVADQVPEFQRGRVSATLGIMQNLGILAAAYVAKWFLSSLVLMFILPGIVALVFVTIYCIVLPDIVISEPPHRASLKTWVMTFCFNPVKHPDFACVWVSRAMIILCSFLFTTFRLFFLQKQLSLSVEEATSAVTLGVLIYTVISVIASLIGGQLSDRLHRRKVFVIAAAIAFALGTYLLAHTHSLSMFYVMEAVMGFGYGMYIAVDMALVVDVLPNPEDSGKDLGVMNIANALPQTFAPTLGAILLGIGTTDASNYQMLFLVAGIAAVIGGLVIIPIKKVK